MTTKALICRRDILRSVKSRDRLIARSTRSLLTMETFHSANETRRRLLRNKPTAEVGMGDS